MIGDWSVGHIYQSGDKPYEPAGGPAVWWRDKTFHVGNDRLAFADWVCEGPHATLRRGSVPKLLDDESASTPEELHMPAETGPVSYYRVKCDRFLIRHGQFQDHPAHFSDVGIDITWNIVVRSKSAIAMPFMAATFVEFLKPRPTT